jgi:hypothetical protein
VKFYKRFWPLLKSAVLQILNDFTLGRVDIARLNFGILSLIPKVPGAKNIKQYRPIALINVIFKLVSKAFAVRLSPVAHRVSRKLRQLSSRAGSFRMALLLCTRLFMN